MVTSTRPFNGDPVHLIVTFAKASLVLEGAVLELLQGDWEEDARWIAHHMAGALRRAARHAGWWERENALRAIESLLALSAAEFLPIRKPVGERLRELLTYLMTVPSSRSA